MNAGPIPLSPVEVFTQTLAVVRARAAQAGPAPGDRWAYLNSDQSHALTDAALRRFGTAYPAQRPALWSGIPLRLLANVPMPPAPLFQIMADVRALNETRFFGDGIVPLEIYLRNALLLSAAAAAPQPSGPWFRSDELPRELENCLMGVKEELAPYETHVDPRTLGDLAEWLINNAVEYAALRPALFEGVHSGYFASLTMTPVPAAQILSDLNTLNQHGPLIGGVVPFEAYLRNLARLIAAS